MLTIIVPCLEGWDSSKEEFVVLKPEVKICLEHSLVSISKWESRWNKPFIGNGYSHEKELPEIIDYIRCMTISQNVPDEVYNRLTEKNIKEIEDYIRAPMTATTVPEANKGPSNREVVTSELIYYWMISYGIPMECQKWHLNRLITLIKVFSAKNSPPKKMSQSELAKRNFELNMRRRKQYNSKG